MKKSVIYTRTGDTGDTSLIGGKRTRKNSPRVSAYGTVDELNAHIGLLLAHITATPDSATLFADIQSTLLSIGNTLFNIGAILATDNSESSDKCEPKYPSLPVAGLEEQIDRLDNEVPQLRRFILPGGSVAASQAHVARTVCRRAERDILSLIDTGVTLPPDIITYINRLSDYLFILARYLNHSTSTPELTWQP